MSEIRNEDEEERVVSSEEEIPKLREQNSSEDSPDRVRNIEEGKDAYRRGDFHPVYIGDIYNERYEVLRKIGYGQYSTVWLVEDSAVEDGSDYQHKVLKILSAESYDEKESVYEREILTRLHKTHPGYKYICHLIDDFEYEGPSDIKLDNIFVKFRDRSLIKEFLEEVPAIQQERHSGSYSPLRSQPLHKFYFKTGEPVINFDVCLGDWGVSSWTTHHLCEVIQPVTLRSPEVLIGAPWDWTTDWWNLGPVILEVFRGVQMFTGKDSQHTPYTVKNHLEEIVNFFGPFPKSLLDQGAPTIVRAVFDEDGTTKASEPLERPGLLSDVYMGDLPLETREDFVTFLHVLMKIDPKERLPTIDFFSQPWIRGRR